MAQYSRKLKRGIRYWYKFDYNNKTYFSKAIYLSKSEAKRAENIRYEEVSRQARNPSEKPNLSLLEAINERLDLLKAKKSEKYYKENKTYYSDFLKTIGNVPMNSITRKAINDFLFKVASNAKVKGNDNYGVNYMLNLLKALFNYAIESHELEIRNPCQGIKPFPVTKKLKYIPSDNDIEAVKSICTPEQKLLIDFISETAARINEPLKVTGKDIFDDYIILYTKKSRNSNIVPRKVPRPFCLKEIKLNSDERLFSYWSDTPKFLQRKVKTLKQKTWSFHNLRHRRASIWANVEKRPLYEVMSLLGHSQLSTTQKYLQMIS